MKTKGNSSGAVRKNNSNTKQRSKTGASQRKKANTPARSKTGASSRKKSRHSKRKNKKSSGKFLIVAILSVLIGYGIYTFEVTSRAESAFTEIASNPDTEKVVDNPLAAPTSAPSPATLSAPTSIPEPVEIQEDIVLDITTDPIISVEDSAVNTVADTVSPYGGNYGSAETPAGSYQNKKLSWYYIRNSNNQPPAAQQEFDIRALGGHYLGDISKKVVYLTFDAGYENGFTGKILDTLKDKNVRAAFFLTQPYIKNQSELVSRMINEGHMICNHSFNHPSFPDLTDDEIIYEIMETERYFNEAYGARMSKYFRPPSGEYSARTLALTQEMGYKTVFWSFAHKDWLTDQQPGKDEAYERVMDGLHNGAVLLLHNISSSNAEALPDIIDSIIAQGFSFQSLDNL
jgi:peptidoglycan-N-acetylmuramic acid deacetylase